MITHPQYAYSGAYSCIAHALIHALIHAQHTYSLRLLMHSLTVVYKDRVDTVIR